jgi:hypothetical protein
VLCVTNTSGKRSRWSNAKSLVKFIHERQAYTKRSFKARRSIRHISRQDCVRERPIATMGFGFGACFRSNQAMFQVSSLQCLVIVLLHSPLTRCCFESGSGVTEAIFLLRPLDLIIRKRNACIAGLGATQPYKLCRYIVL